MIFKEHQLALEEQARRLPIDFKLSGYWRFAYQGVRVLFWVNLTLLLIHLYQLFSMAEPR